MKTINLKSLIYIYKANGQINLDTSIQKYLGEDYDIEIKDNELNALESFIQAIDKHNNSLSLKYFNGFYLGYKIPQIGKEFDLLRLSKSIILNIEYKRKISDIDKVKKQIIKNHYYLNFLNKDIYSYVYIKEENNLYKIDEYNNLITSDFDEFLYILQKQIDDEENSLFEENLNDLFQPANYLVSPFNKTSEFVKGLYFLTQEQDKVKNDILKILNNEKYFLIEGNAGSGKSLLVYDIAKEIINNSQNVGIIHCGNLNQGHETLKSLGWVIKRAKDWQKFFENNPIPDILIIDEIQRMYKPQIYNLLSQYICKMNIKLILCGDEKQILSKWEGKYKEVLEELQITPISFKLTSKIRTNKEISNFIQIMFDYSKKNTLKVSKKNINIVCFEKFKEANEYIKSKTNYKYISYTPSQYNTNHYADFGLSNPQKVGTAHEVIGQDFDNIIVSVNDLFFYDGKYLKVREMNGVPYIPKKMFFQQITRAINKIDIVIIKNIDLYNKLIKIFD